MRKFIFGFIAGIAVLVSMQGLAHALINADFETGDFTGWTTFYTAGGTAYGGTTIPYLPVVSSFDVDGDGTATYAAHFKVACLRGQTGTYRGGGMSQDVDLYSGDLTVSADIACFGSSYNVQKGFFELLVDGTVVDSESYGSATGRRTLSGTTSFLSDGTHEIKFLVRRQFSEANYDQYIDNIVLSGSALTNGGSAVPEPASMGLLSFGLLGFGFIKRKF